MALAPGHTVLVIYPPDDPLGTPSGTLTDAFDKRVVVQWGEPGGGEFTISALSSQAAWCVPGAYVLAYRDVVTTPADALAGFWLEPDSQTILSTSEGGGKLLRCGGTGPIACLEEMVAMHRRRAAGALARVQRRRGNWRYRATGEMQLVRVLLTQLREAHAWDALPFVSWTFTGTHDSDGEAWDDDLAFRRYAHPIGVTMTELVTMLRAKGLSIEMDAAMRISAWPEDRVNDLSGSVDIVAGVHIAGDVVRQRGARRGRSTALVGGERRRGGERFVVVHNPTYRSTLGRRKVGFRDVGRTATPKVLRRVGRRSLRRWWQTRDGAVGLPVLDADGQVALVDYRPGDTVTVTIPGYYSTGQRVDGISLVDIADGSYNPVVEFAGLLPDRHTGEDFTDDAATVARGAL